MPCRTAEPQGFGVPALYFVVATRLTIERKLRAGAGLLALGHVPPFGGVVANRGYPVRVAVKGHSHAGVSHSYVVASPVPENHRRESRDLYSPLKDTPGLFLAFGELADHEIDEDVWRDWFTRNGVLALRPGSPYMASVKGGSEETFSRFVEEARIANGVLRSWEAATAEQT